MLSSLTSVKCFAVGLMKPTKRTEEQEEREGDDFEVHGINAEATVDLRRRENVRDLDSRVRDGTY